jgi:arsenite methyltransferase
MAQATANPAKPDYGLDAPNIVKRMVTRGVWTLVVGVAVFFVNRNQYPGPSGALIGVLGAIAGVFFLVAGIMVWSSRVAKLQVRDRLHEALQIAEDDRVLDVGCGRGLMVIGAAKRLKTGKATGVDIWSSADLSGNSAEAAKENAKLEGVADRVRIENCDARKLVYPDNHYDVVVSSLCIHNISDRAGRDQAVKEMWRVLKPGGRLAIFDLFHAGRYAEVLHECGASDVRLSPWGFLWCLPTRSVMARK